MNYKKAYERAFDLANQLYNQVSDSMKENLKIMFPELRDKNEKIRIALLEYFNDFNLPTFAGLDPKDIIDWLEELPTND